MLSKNRKKWKGGVRIDKKRLGIFFWMLFCIFFIGYLLFCNLRIFQTRNDLFKSVNQLDDNIEALTKEKETLSFNLGQTYDPDYIEKVAREDLGMQKSGEQVVVIKKNDVAENIEESAQGNIWNTIVNWFNAIKKNFLPE